MLDLIKEWDHAFVETAPIVYVDTNYLLIG